MLVVPLLTVTPPPVTVTFDREIDVLSPPSDETFPLNAPPVRFADPPESTDRLVRLAFEFNVPSGRTLVIPVTVGVPPIRFVVPAVAIEPIVPAEMLAVAMLATVRLPRLIAESRVPAVTLALPLKVPAERFEVPPFTIRPLSVPPVWFRLTDVVVLPETVPPEILADPPTAFNESSVPLLMVRMPLDVTLPRSFVLFERFTLPTATKLAVPATVRLPAPVSSIWPPVTSVKLPKVIASVIAILPVVLLPMVRRLAVI